MGRKRVDRDKPYTTMHVTQDAYQIVHGFKMGTEPIPNTLDRILKDYTLQREKNRLLQNRIEELEFINGDLRDTLNISREKNMKLESYVQK